MYKILSYNMYKQLKLLDKTVPDNLNADKVDNNMIYIPQEDLPLRTCVTQKIQFQQGKNDIDRDKNISMNGKWENSYYKLQGKLQTTNSASLQQVTKEEEVKKNILKEIDNYIYQTFIAQQPTYDATLSQKNVREIKPVQEQFGRTQQQMTTNIETSSIEMANMNKDDDKENKTAYFDLLATKNYEEIKRIRFHKLLLEIILRNKYKMSDEELEFTRTDSVEQYIIKKFLELKNKMPKFDLKNQEYMKIIDKLCCNEKDVHVECQEDEDKNKNHKIKHEEYKSDLYIMLLNKLMELYTEIERWQQRFENNQIELMAMMTGKQKAELELLKLTTKMTKLQKLCNSHEKEKMNLLLNLKSKNNKTSGTESFNASTSQKSIPQEKSQQISSEINSVSSSLQDILKKQVPEKQVHKDSDKNYISLPLIIQQQEMMGEDYHRITLPTTNITNTETDKTMELPEQINKDSLIELQDSENKVKELNKYTVKIMELLENSKMNGKSTVVEEQVPTSTKDLNKNKADESPEQVDALIGPSIDFEEMMNRIGNKEIRATKLLKDMKMNDESIVIEKQIRGKDFKIKELNKYIAKMMELLEDSKMDGKSSVVEEQVPTFTKDLNKNKADELSEQVDALIEPSIDFEEIMNKIGNKEIRATKLLKDMKINDESIVIEKQIRDKDFEDKLKELNKYTVKMTELSEDSKINGRSTVVEEQVSTSTKDLNKNKADELSEQIDALIGPSIDFEEMMSEIENKEIRETKLLKDMKINDKSIVIEKQVRGKDKVTDAKAENEKHGTMSTKNLILSLPFYESLRSDTTKDQNKDIIKNIMDKAYQRKSPDNHSFKYSYLYKKINDACTSQQKDKNQVEVSEAGTNVGKHAKCTHRDLDENIKLKYHQTNDYVNKEYQIIENNKNKEHETLNETVEEDQATKVVKEIEIKETENTDLDSISNETLLYARDVILKNNDKVINGNLTIEDISNILHKIDKIIDFSESCSTIHTENLLS